MSIGPLPRPLSAPPGCSWTFWAFGAVSRNVTRLSACTRGYWALSTFDEAGRESSAGACAIEAPSARAMIKVRVIESLTSNVRTARCSNHASARRRRQRFHHGGTKRTETHGGCHCSARVHRHVTLGASATESGSTARLRPAHRRCQLGQRASSLQCDSLRASPFAPCLRGEPVASVSYVDSLSPVHPLMIVSRRSKPNARSETTTIGGP